MPSQCGHARAAHRGWRVSERRLHHADSAAFRNAMRSLSSGVAVVACGDGDQRVGCTVTSFASLSLTPPTLFVCLARSSSTLAGLQAARAFSVNLLASRHEALAHRFSGRGGVHGRRRFEGALWIALATGRPFSPMRWRPSTALSRKQSSAIRTSSFSALSSASARAWTSPRSPIRGGITRPRPAGLGLRNDMEERAGDAAPS